MLVPRGEQTILVTTLPFSFCLVGVVLTSHLQRLLLLKQVLLEWHLGGYFGAHGYAKSIGLGYITDPSDRILYLLK